MSTAVVVEIFRTLIGTDSYAEMFYAGEVLFPVSTLIIQCITNNISKQQINGARISLSKQQPPIDNQQCQPEVTTCIVNERTESP